MDFWKINGNGNDFITFDMIAAPRPLDELSALARRLCPRRSAIGADGLLIVEGSNAANFKMRLINADGSEGEMCGNGARCIARYAYERGLAPAEMSFETLDGIKKARVEGTYVEIDMGVADYTKGWVDRPLTMDGATFRSCFAWVGVPHLTLFSGERFSRDEMVEIGRKFRNSLDLFPQGTNVSFVEPAGRGELDAVTYERGVEDLTDSCGTGCTASALSAHMLFNMNSPIDVHNPGGTNRITFTQVDEHKFSAKLGGATKIVARGEIGPDV